MATIFEQIEQILDDYTTLRHEQGKYESKLGGTFEKNNAIKPMYKYEFINKVINDYPQFFKKKINE